MAWWSTPAWRAVKIRNPRTGRVRWLGPYSLDQSRAANWLGDTQQTFWHDEVTIYTARAGRWTQGLS